MAKNILLSSRIKDLDFLRGIAIILVLGSHLLFIPDTLPDFIRNSFLLLKQVGWIGVDLFFVISGFLVSGLLFKEFQAKGNVLLLRFLIRRGFKIYPSFYVFLFLLLSISYFFETWPGFSISKGLQEAIFIQNYTVGLEMHTWSLAVEEHFYFLLVSLIYILVILNPNKTTALEFLPKICIVLMCGVLLIRTLVGAHLPIGAWPDVLPRTHFRIDSLLYGVLLSYFYYFFPDRIGNFFKNNVKLLLISSIISLSPVFIYKLTDSRFLYTTGFTLIYLAFGNLMMLLIFSNSHFKSKLFESLRFVCNIGRWSYCIYLWHLPVYIWSKSILQHCLEDTCLFYVHLIIYLMTSIGAGFIFSEYIETPLLRYRDRKYPNPFSR